MSRWQEQPILLRRLHHQRFRDDVVSPCVRVMKLASIISTSPIVIIRSVQIMNPYCKEGGLGAQLAAHSRTLTTFSSAAFSAASILLIHLNPSQATGPGDQRTPLLLHLLYEFVPSPRVRTFPQPTTLDLTTNRGLHLTASFS